jgi:chorismate mutase/prephenate dehydratase
MENGADSHQSTATSANLGGRTQTRKSRNLSPLRKPVRVADIGPLNSNHQKTHLFILSPELESRARQGIPCNYADHESGTLYQTLRYFAEARISLVKIESRTDSSAL